VYTVAAWAAPNSRIMLTPNTNRPIMGYLRFLAGVPWDGRRFFG